MVPTRAILLALCIGAACAQVCPDALGRHNFFRGLHSSPALQWDSALAARAQASAAAKAKNGCALQGGEVGNMWFCQGASCGSCVDAVNAWYKTLSNFKITTTNMWTDNKANFGAWAAGTQLIWARVGKVGCAIAHGDKCSVVDCLYDTFGNVPLDTEFATNIKPARNTPSTTPAASPVPTPSVPAPTPVPTPSVPAPTPTPAPTKPPAVPSSTKADRHPWCQHWKETKQCRKGWVAPDPVTGVTTLVSELCPVSCAVLLD